MFNPKVKLLVDKRTILEMGLWELIAEKIYHCELSCLAPLEKLELYLNSERVEQPTYNDEG